MASHGAAPGPSTPPKNSGLAGGFGRTFGRVDAKDGDIVLHEVAEQIAVIAGDLDHEALRPQMPVGDQG